MDAATDVATHRVLETRDVSPASLARRLRDEVVRSGRSQPSWAAAERGSAYILPWRKAETVFAGPGRAEVPVDQDETRQFLAGVATGGQLVYGYPLVVDGRGRLAPLVFAPVVLRRESDAAPTIAMAPGWRARVNHRPLAYAGFDAVGREALVDALEHGSFSGLRAFLDHLAAVLGLEQRFVPDALPAPPDGPLPSGWHDLPGLFQMPQPAAAGPDEAGMPEGPAAIDPALLADLDRIAAGSGKGAGRTAALEALTAAEPVSRPPTVMPIEPADVGIGNVPVLEAATAAALSVIDAADPDTAGALVLDLAASTVVDGQSVLYVAPDAVRLDAVERHLAAVLGPAAGQVIRLDRAGLRSSASIGSTGPRADAPGDSPPLPTPTLSELAEQRRAAAETTAAAMRLKAAHVALSDTQRRRIGLEAAVDPGWTQLFRTEHRLSISADAIAGWQARLGGRTPSAARGLGRLMRRRQSAEVDPAEAVGALVEALAPVPPSIVARLPLPGETADPAALRHAFDQLALLIKWHAALAREVEQEAAVEREAPVADLARRTARSREIVVAMSRRILPERWGTVAGVDAEGDRQLAEALATLIERRVSDAGADDGARDRAIVKALGKAAGRFPLILATPADVARRLPLVGGLVDLVVVDHAEAIAAASLPPLLERARRACVIGHSAASGGFSDAHGLAAAGRGADRRRLDDRAPRDPAIAAYLVDRAGGGWSPRPDSGGEVVVDLPESVRGLRRHAPPDLGRHGEIAAAIELLRSWKTLGLFDQVPRPTIGVATPLPDDADRLRRTLKAVVPTTAAERSVVVGVPESFIGRRVDLLVLMPGLVPPPSEERGKRLAASQALYVDAVRAARSGVHVIAARDPAMAAGGHLAALVAAADARRKRYGPARDMLAALVEQAGLAAEISGEVPTAFGPFGTAYRLGFGDDRETTAALLGRETEIAPPAAAPVPVLLDRAAVIDRPDLVLEHLRRLA